MAGRTTKEPSRWVGRVLCEKWRIDARLARGGVGTVFSATHRQNGSKVAIKILHPEFSRDEDTRSRFLQEGYAANKVGHPGVARILDNDVTEEGYAFLVMELLKGEILEKRRIRKGGTLPVSEVLDFGDQLLAVLAAAHDQRIVHRDIKPDNLFVTTRAKLKVLDFGFAQMRSKFRKEQTETGFLLGTPGYMSPEQAAGKWREVDARTDIWAVGATLFTLLSGKPVHPVDNAAGALIAAATQEPRSLRTVTSNLPEELVTVVDRALAFDKSRRWPSARAMQSALRAVPNGERVDERPSRKMFLDLGSVPSLADDADDIEGSGAEATVLDRYDEVPRIEPDAGPTPMYGPDEATVRRGRAKATPRRDDAIPVLDGDEGVDPNVRAATLVMESSPRMQATREARASQPSFAQMPTPPQAAPPPMVATPPSPKVNPRSAVNTVGVSLALRSPGPVFVAAAVTVGLLLLGGTIAIVLFAMR